MEEYGEAEICWENIMRRIDAENKLADRVMEMWEDDICVHKGGEEGTRERDGWVGNEMIRESKGDVKKGAKKKKEKEKTGEEMRKLIQEKNELRYRKKAVAEGKKMVRKGKMKTLDRYYK